MQLTASTIRKVNHKRRNAIKVLNLDFSAQVPFRFCFEELSREDAPAPTKQTPPRDRNNIEDKVHWSLDSDDKARLETLEMLLREVRENEELAEEEEEERQAEEQSLQVLEELADQESAEWARRAAEQTYYELQVAALESLVGEESDERTLDTIIGRIQDVEVN